MNIRSNPAKEEFFCHSKSGTILLELLISMVIYSIALMIAFESITLLSKSILQLSSHQKEVEDFEDTMIFLNKEIHGKECTLITHANWTLLLLKKSPVVAFLILRGKDREILRRIVANDNLTFEKLSQIKPGLHYINTHFSGFNTIYDGKEEIDFWFEGNHLVFGFGKRKVYMS